MHGATIKINNLLYLVGLFTVFPRTNDEAQSNSHQVFMNTGIEQCGCAVWVPAFKYLESCSLSSFNLTAVS